MTAGARPDPRPDLSVIIAATDSPEAVARTLGSLGGPDARRVEVIVAAPWPTAGGGARHVQGPPKSGVPALRWLGLQAARGRLVAFTEDSCVARPGWVDAWIAAFADPALAAASGLVEHDAGATLIDWAVVFCEYAPFLGDRGAGPPPRLAGNNFAATREAVALASAGGEVHEVALLASVVRTGGEARLVPGAMVRHVRRFGAREAFGDRFRFGLEFGRMRVASASRVVRWLGPAAGPAIFASQLARVGRSALASRHRGRFVRALPIALALLASWTLGEWAGWTWGPSKAKKVDRPAKGDRPRSGSLRRRLGLRRGP